MHRRPVEGRQAHTQWPPGGPSNFPVCQFGIDAREAREMLQSSPVVPSLPSYLECESGHRGKPRRVNGVTTHVDVLRVRCHKFPLLLTRSSNRYTCICLKVLPIFTAYTSRQKVRRASQPPSMAQSCTMPIGLSVPGDVPCFANGGPCCPAGWSCRSNGLCLSPDGDSRVQPSCTDWSDDSCSQICHASKHIRTSPMAAVWLG